MEVFRLARKQYAEPLSGKGAALKGARWNSVGVELIYTAANKSLAMAKVAVHFTWATLPDDYVMTSIFLPDDISIKHLQATDLPSDWAAFPHAPSVRHIGDNFVAENKYCVLEVPSAVTQGDYNLLINPNHSEFKGIRITQIVPFPFDKKLFK